MVCSSNRQVIGFTGTGPTLPIILLATPGATIPTSTTAVYVQNTAPVASASPYTPSQPYPHQSSQPYHPSGIPEAVPYGAQKQPNQMYHPHVETTIYPTDGYIEFDVIIPEGVYPGMRFQAVCNGRTTEVVCPPGHGPGMQLRVRESTSVSI